MFGLFRVCPRCQILQGRSNFEVTSSSVVYKILLFIDIFIYFCFSNSVESGMNEIGPGEFRMFPR